IKHVIESPARSQSTCRQTTAVPFGCPPEPQTQHRPSPLTKRWARAGSALPCQVIPHSPRENSMGIRNKVVAGAMTAAALGVGLVAAPAASADSCNRTIGACIFYNSGYSGASFWDGGGNSHTPENYGAPNWYTFSGGNGSGLYVKNNAASVYNYDTNYSVT